MKTIKANSKGSEFIQDLNDNFAECVSVADGSVAVNAIMQGGELKSATGYVDGRWCTSASTPTWTDDNFYKYLHTPCYLSLKGNKVKGVVVPTGSTLSIFCYDDSFTLLSSGVVNDEDDIPDSATYVKMQIYNASGYSQVVALEMTLAARPEWVKNVATPLVPQFFNYDCKPPKLWDDANYTTPHVLPVDGTADMDNTRYHDNAFVMLPPQYDPKGEPCKVVLWFNGDGCGWFIDHGISVSSVYDANFKYLNACGYAVVQCMGYTSMWKDEQGSTQASMNLGRISPAYIASVRALYDHVMRNYNFDPQVYLGAKSAGGDMMMHTALTLPFPVRAAAGMDVGINAFDTMRHSWVNTQKAWQKRLGCSNWDEFQLSQSGSGSTATLVHNGSGATDTQKADAKLLKDNMEIYRNILPFFMNSDIDLNSFVTQNLLLTDVFNDGADYPTALTDIVYAAHKVVNTPIKLWCSTKDDAAPYTWHKIMVEWIQRNGGIAELRSYTGSDGTHHTFCGGTSGGGKVINNLPTPYGSTMSGVNIGFVEAVEWFKRW